MKGGRIATRPAKARSTYGKGCPGGEAARAFELCATGTLSDVDLEGQIDMEALAMHTAKTPIERAAAWERLQALIKRRSPDQVARMERAKGL